MPRLAAPPAARLWRADEGGTGTLVISGPQSFTGNTVINEGTLRLSGATASLGAITTAAQ